MLLRILYSNALASDALCYAADIDEKVRKIFSAAENEHSVKFQTGKKNELLLPGLSANEVWNITQYLGNKFIDLNEHFRNKTPKFSTSRTTSTMKRNFKSSKETTCIVEISSTENELRELIKIPGQDL